MVEVNAEVDRCLFAKKSKAVDVSVPYTIVADSLRGVYYARKSALKAARVLQMACLLSVLCFR